MRLLNKFDLISYAMDFASFLLRGEEVEGTDVKEIILFGSVARGDFGPESDVDIFVDLYKTEDEEKTEDSAQRRLKKFYQSESYDRWKLRGVENEINVKVGVLEEWKLEESIETEGITLYSDYKGISPGTKMDLFVFEPIKPVKTRNRVVRKIFGRSDTKKSGLLEELSGIKLTPRSFMVPRKNTDRIKEVLDENKVDYRIFSVHLERSI